MAENLNILLILLRLEHISGWDFLYINRADCIQTLILGGVKKKQSQNCIHALIDFFKKKTLEPELVGFLSLLPALLPSPQIDHQRKWSLCFAFAMAHTVNYFGAAN